MNIRKQYHVAIIGATGAVGNALLQQLEKRNFPIASLSCFASKRSMGQTVQFKNSSLPLQLLTENSFKDVDIAFFAAGKEVSKLYVPLALAQKTWVIDSSSAFRKEVPLVIPEINSDAIKEHQLICSPNCVASILLMVLAPLHKKQPIKRIVASTYQAFSGGGNQEVEKMKNATQAFLNEKTPSYYAFNLFLHPTPKGEDDYLEEERKVIEETKKILDDPTIEMSVTCVRVPTLRVHSISLNVEFNGPMSKHEALTILSQSAGIAFMENPTPFAVSQQDPVFYGRVREDKSRQHCLDFFVMGDQLLKGAALNAVQIAETITMRQPCHLP